MFKIELSSFVQVQNKLKLGIEECVRDIDDWMTVNIFKMNRDKTELLVLSARRRPLPPLETLSRDDDAANENGA